ncbi:hypothetical protein L596_017484 [Steinernema carpocapsae]|uniref:Secreted protein n=1 Tax=Steinernema carpocapsae TaxID=34508 RepID=A0A4U5N219_STECR|nr:hypothetical protein L596_017484 [Steinernema carpocapsae]
MVKLPAVICLFSRLVCLLSVSSHPNNRFSQQHQAFPIHDPLFGSQRTARVLMDLPGILGPLLSTNGAFSGNEVAWI